MKKYLIATILVCSNQVGAFELQSGIGLTESVKDSLWNTSIPYAVARQGQRAVDNNHSVVAFFDAGEIIYSLSSDAKLIRTASTSRAVEGSWKLNTFPGYFLESTLPISAPSNEVVTDAPNQGCLLKTPLRYGDVDQDGQLELVIFLGGVDQTDLFIFSPLVKKTIFGMNISSLHSQGIDGFNDDSPEAYQYNSDIQNTPVPTSEPGFQAYGKIFIDDFDDDKARDIILWHKYYESRENKDSIKGFKKVSDTFIHYKLINGEYQKQATPEETIKSWLAAKQLTWQKGYPSKSECPGQEGQLIPEMHDPLLNDPDVLQ